MTDEASLNFIKNYFKEQGQDMTSNNKQQALVIEDAIVLPNKHGMAPGMLVELGKKNNSTTRSTERNATYGEK